MHTHSAFLPYGLDEPAMLRPLSSEFPNQSVAFTLSAASCEFSTLTSRAEFEALEHEWTELFERAGNGRQIFQNFNWLWHWCNHFLDPDDRSQQLSIVIGRKAGTLVLVWPLVIQRCNGLRHLNWMGLPVSQYGDVVMDRTRLSADDLQASWAYLTQNIAADVIHLRKVREDAAVAQVLRTNCNTPIARLTAPYLDFSDTTSFEDYQKKYSGKARKNRRRLRRRIEERAELTITTHVDGDIRSRLASRAVELKRIWLEARGLVSSAIQDERTRLFFKDAAASPTHPTGCRTTALKIDDQTVAIEVSFIAKGHCAVHVIVYHMDYEKTGAGVVLMEDSIRSAIEAGVTTFDLMAPGDNYKLDWADGSVGVEDWLQGVTLAGRIYQTLRMDRLNDAAKSTINMLPLSLRRLLNHGFARTKMQYSRGCHTGHCEQATRAQSATPGPAI